MSEPIKNYQIFSKDLKDGLISKLLTILLFFEEKMKRFFDGNFIINYCSLIYYKLKKKLINRGRLKICSYFTLNV